MERAQTTEPVTRDAREALARALGQRARERRIALGMTKRGIAEAILGVTPTELAGWEQRLPHRYRSVEARWEVALQVPEGWLRDTSLAAPAIVHKSPSSSRRGRGRRIQPDGPVASTITAEEGTVAHEIIQLCARLHARDTSALESMSNAKRRMVSQLACRAGVFGPSLATIPAVAERFGRTAAYVSVLERKLRDHLRASGARIVTPALDSMVEKAQQYLPCTSATLDTHLRRELGANLSVSDANRFARHVLGVKCLDIVLVGAEEVVLCEGVTQERLEIARSACVRMIRVAGAARVDVLAKRLRWPGGEEIGAETAARWFEALGGFEWLDRSAGWFWLGPTISSRVGSAAIKVLAAAGCAVHIEDLHQVAVPTMHNDATQLPLDVLMELLSRHDGVTRADAHHLKLTGMLKLETVMTPRELLLHAALVARGSEATRLELVNDLVVSGAMPRQAFDTVISESEIVVRVGTRSYGLRGRRTDRMGCGRPLSKPQRKKQAKLAMARRKQLGLTLLQLAQRTGVLTPSHILTLERCLPVDPVPGEDHLERALEVPRGWLRTPQGVVGADQADSRHLVPEAAAFASATVARDLAELFNSSFKDVRLSRATHSRNVEIATWMCGLHGRADAARESVAARFGVSESVVEDAMQQVRNVMCVVGPQARLPALERLMDESRTLLPMAAEEFERRFGHLLGGGLSLIDLVKTGRKVLGRDTFQLSLSGRGVIVLAAGDGPDRYAAVSKLVTAAARSTGGVQIDWLCGALSGVLHHPVPREDAVRWAQMLDGFYWISERDGWFSVRFSSSWGTSARQSILKVLSIAPGEVTLADLMGVVWHLRRKTRWSDLSRERFVEMPAHVFDLFMDDFPEVTRVVGAFGPARYRLRQAISPETLLTGAEMRAYRILSSRGGVIARSSIVGAEATGDEAKNLVDMVVNNLLVAHVDRGICRLRGFPLDPAAYARACQERPHDEPMWHGVDDHHA